MAAALNLPRKYGVVISDVKQGSTAEAAGVQIGDILAGLDGRPVDNLPFVAFHFLSMETGDKVHLDLLRGRERFALDVKVMEPAHDMDQIAALADPEKNLVPTLGIVGVEIDKKIAAMAPDLRDPFGILVAGRAAGRGVGGAVNAGGCLRPVTGQPMA